MHQRRIRILALFACASMAAGLLPAQTRAAVRTKFEAAIYPEDPEKKKDLQGNVLLIGRIDKQGNVSDIHVIGATRKEFMSPAIDSVKTWKFEPAMRDGKPIEVPLNAGVRFRMTGGGRGQIPRPILGDIAVYPADANGKKTAPDAFPLWKGKDPALRVEAVLDVPPSDQPRTVAVKAEAVSPTGRKVPLFLPPVAIPAVATEVTFPVVAQIGTDWEDGVWLLKFTADGNPAGGGQFWLATNPATFPFALPVQ
jgi:TonB family protein